MDHALRKTGLSFREIYQSYLPLVYRVAFTYLRNPQDSEDAAQEAFLRLYRREESFQSAEHCKAWLIVTAGNICKDMLRRKDRTELPLEDFRDLASVPREENGLLSAILELPEKYRTLCISTITKATR